MMAVGAGQGRGSISLLLLRGGPPNFVELLPSQLS